MREGKAPEMNSLDRFCPISFVTIASMDSTSAMIFPITFVIASVGGISV